MKEKDFRDQAKNAAKQFGDKTKAKQPETQFMKGALWAWELLMSCKSQIYYEQRLRQQIKERLGQDPEPWMDEIIETTADLLVDRDELTKEIRESGRTWTSYDKNMNQKKESCPHIAHKKDVLRTLADYYQSLGLSFKATPSKIKEDTRRGVDHNDPMIAFLEAARGLTNPDSDD